MTSPSPYETAGPVDRVRELARRAGRWLRGARQAYLSPLERRDRVRLDLGPAVPGWLLRLLAAAVAVGCLVTVLDRGFLLLPAAAVALLVRPGRLVPALVVLTTAAVLAFSPASLTQTAWLVLGLHLMAVLGLVAGQVSWRARIELAVLGAPLRRLVAIQLIAQPIALLGGLAAGARVSLAVLPVIAVLALGALVVLWAPWAETTRGD